jgi:hypothetical protein
MKTPEEKIVLTNNALEISLNQSGVIGIKGRAMDGILADFFKPVEKWIDSYSCNPADLTSIDFRLEYSNRSNSLIFIYLLKKIVKIKQLSKRLVINWYYEEGDEDIFEQGEYISTIVNVPFNFIEISDPLLSEYSLLKLSDIKNSRAGVRYKYNLVN